MSEDLETTIKTAVYPVLDPHMGISIVDMGLLHEINVDGEDVEIVLKPTNPGCMSVTRIAVQVKELASNVDGVENVIKTISSVLIVGEKYYFIRESMLFGSAEEIRYGFDERTLSITMKAAADGFSDTFVQFLSVISGCKDGVAVFSPVKEIPSFYRIEHTGQFLAESSRADPLPFPYRHQKQPVIAGGYVHLQLFRHPEELRQRSVAHDKRPEQHLPLIIALFAEKFFPPVKIRHGLLLFDLFFYLPDAAQQFFRRQRLKQIFRDAQGNSPLGVGKLIVSRKNDDPGLRKFLPDQGREFQTVHERHLDVRKQNVRFCLQNHRIGKFSVACFACEFDIFLFPVNLAFDAVPHHDLIFHQKQFNHSFPSLTASYMILSGLTLRGRFITHQQIAFQI